MASKKSEIEIRRDAFYKKLMEMPRAELEAMVSSTVSRTYDCRGAMKSWIASDIVNAQMPLPREKK
jgi:hypothetical protein